MSTRLHDSNGGDSFDLAHITLDWDYVQSNSSISIQSGIDGMTGNCFLLVPFNFSGFDSMLRRNLDNYHARLFVGFRLRAPALPLAGSSYLFGFWDTGNIQCVIKIDSAGRIALWNGYGLSTSPGSLIVQTGSGLIHPNVNAHIGIDITFGAASNGSVTIYVDSQQMFTQSGITTSAYSASGADQVSIHSGILSGSNGFYFDDIYVEDSLPSKIDQKGITTFPTGAGQYSEQAIGGSAPAVTRWQSVNETVPDDGVTVVVAATAGLRNTYKVTQLPSNVASIESVTTLLDASVDVSGLGAGCTVAPLIGNGSTVSAGTAQSVNTSFYYKRQMFANNPITSAPFTLLNWNAVTAGVEFGHKRIV